MIWGRLNPSNREQFSFSVLFLSVFGAAEKHETQLFYSKNNEYSTFDARCR